MTVLSRYHPRFVRSLVYMLQASEYDVRDYLAWYHRTRNFAQVERRKTLVWTGKAKTLFALSWGLIIVWIVGVMAFASSTGSDVPLMVCAGIVLLTPFYFPYVLAGLVALINVAQRPVEDRIVSRAAQKLAGHKGFKIAIAGSYGKTSMREILKTVLSEGKKVAAPGGSHNTPLAVAQFIEGLQGDEEVLIFELGEYYPGDVKKLCEVIKPDLGVITGVNEAHLARFKTLGRAADTIFELAPFVAPEALYINGENEVVEQRSDSRNIVYSRRGAGRFAVGSAQSDLDGTSFSLVMDDDSRVEAHSQLLGVHQVGPLVAAADIASRLGLTLDSVLAGLAKTKPFAHRLERKDSDGVITLDDSYNGNPDGVKAVIEFLSSIHDHRRWYVTPGLVEMGTRSREVHQEIGRQLADAKIEKVVLIKNSVTPWIEQGLRQGNFSGEIVWFDDALRCYESLPHLTVAGDVVLLQNDWPDQYA